MQSLLTSYASHLMERGGHAGKLAAVELYRKAKKSAEAAQLLSELAKTAAAKGLLKRAKKLQVLCALELEEFKKRTLAQDDAGQSGGQTNVQATLDNLMTLDAASISTTGSLAGADNAWRAAEAYHFSLLAERLLYQGNVASAMEVAEYLTHFDDVLEAKYVYSSLAMSAYFNKHYGLCSKAFVRLEALVGLTDAERKAYAEMALQIFMRNPPVDPPTNEEVLASRKAKNPRLCTASGQRMLKRGRIYRCQRCRRHAYEHELQAFSNCPLCHGEKAKYMQPSR